MRENNPSAKLQLVLSLMRDVGRMNVYVARNLYQMDVVAGHAFDKICVGLSVDQNLKSRVLLLQNWNILRPSPFLTYRDDAIIREKFDGVDVVSFEWEIAKSLLVLPRAILSRVADDRLLLK